MTPPLRGATFGLIGAFQVPGGTFEMGDGWTASFHTDETQERSDAHGSWSAGWARRF